MSSSLFRMRATSQPAVRNQQTGYYRIDENFRIKPVLNTAVPSSFQIYWSINLISWFSRNVFVCDLRKKNIKKKSQTKSYESLWYALCSKFAYRRKFCKKNPEKYETQCMKWRKFFLLFFITKILIFEINIKKHN